MKVRTALISVSDKTGLKELVESLNGFGVKILSTGGTAKAIASYSVPVTEVSDYVDYPEILDGRVKTLHPKIHAGLLARRDSKDHMAQLTKLGIDSIDMVVVNLYPFEETLNRTDDDKEIIENIDIGGPTMLRSAAKNFESVAVLSSPYQYKEVIDEMRASDGEIGDSTLRRLALDVFRMTSYYDSKISAYLERESDSRDIPSLFTKGYKKVMDLRYGENPHQRAAFFSEGKVVGSICSAKQHQGKELSFNNIMDLDSAVRIVSAFSLPAAAIIKHNNPCGAATGKDIISAYLSALECDRLSAFGSIVGLNREVDEETARAVLESGFVECVIAPSFTEGALKAFAAKKNLRVMELSGGFGAKGKEFDIKRVRGGILVQDGDDGTLKKEQLKVVTKVSPTDSEVESLLFGFQTVKYIKSNAICLVKGTQTVGIGAGQMSRVDSVKIAIEKAGDSTKGAVLASDAFFPKPDSIEAAHKAGITAIIQPGGSIADQEIIDACDKAGISMVFTGQRHFRH